MPLPLRPLPKSATPPRKNLPGAPPPNAPIGRLPPPDPFTGDAGGGGDAQGGPTAAEMRRYFDRLMVSTALAPTRHQAPFHLDGLAATANYKLIFENAKSTLVKVFVWIDFSVAGNGSLRLSRVNNDNGRVDELEASGKIVSNGILVPARGKLFIRNMAPTAYTFLEADKANVGIFDLDDLG